MDRIPCNSCDKRVVPRLWHYRPFLAQIYVLPIRYMKTQHLCPFCGSCMYETGGEVTTIGKLVFALVVIPFTFLLVFFPNAKVDEVMGYYQHYCIVATAVVMYRPVKNWVLRIFKKT
jgi:hypothetical protein